VAEEIMADSRSHVSSFAKTSVNLKLKSLSSHEGVRGGSQDGGGFPV